MDDFEPPIVSSCRPGPKAAPSRTLPELKWFCYFLGRIEFARIMQDGRPNMDIEGVRVALRKEPFEPFSMRLADGRSLPVLHPEFVALGKRRIVGGNGHKKKGR